MRRDLGRAALGLLALGMVAAGCGKQLPLPTETPGARAIPSDKSYQMIATWTGMTGIRDILLTQGTGTQLFLLFNQGGSGGASRGQSYGFPLSRPIALPGIEFTNLFNPVALCAGGGKVFVLDQGDTCLARQNPATGTCDSTQGWDNRITDLSKYWRVREYRLLGGDTISTFTDTNLVIVHGVAADAQGNVYVSGSAIVLVVDPQSSRLRTRTLQYRVFRYKRGPRYPGVVPPDYNMPGANWHRDTTWVVEEGAGIGTVVDPRGLFWSGAGGAALYVADYGKNWVQKIDVNASSSGFYQIDGGGTGATFNGPTDVTVDLQGYVYVADTGNRRVLRYAPDGTFVQIVNVELDAQSLPLQDPVAVAADDSLAYVGDAQLHKVIRYKRRP